MSSDVLFDLRGPVAFVTLNRPEALNALTLGVIRPYAERLAAWARDPAVAAVVLRGAGDRAFCAGGDIRAVCRTRGGPEDETDVFFREEYALDGAVARFPKAHVALWNGITMGGGVGLSVFGSHRVATERTLFAMPETGIGFFCDVGATWLLPRLPGQSGMYLALTGSRVGPADAVELGLATHFVPSGRLGELEEALVRAPWSGDGRETAEAVLGAFAEPAGAAPLSVHREAIDRCFSADSVEEIVRRLEGERSAWARETLETLGKKSPTSLKVVHEALRRGAALELDDALAVEVRLSQRFVVSHDFCEGVRAALEDQDHRPRWQPPTLPEVSSDLVASYFALSREGNCI
ncbi:MAG: enoyl-CoA hydratase/isomerase family protein [Deltaproteobacteria bacterium]|nr:enoyl-CoA hydratase/isomerase family protein [Deltaproteobacteria bacterium]